MPPTSARSLRAWWGGDRDVIGIDVAASLLEVAGGVTEQEDLLPWFCEEDLRYMQFDREFDVGLRPRG